MKNILFNFLFSYLLIVFPVKITPSIENVISERRVIGENVKVDYTRVEVGCPYNLRCPFVMEMCRKNEP
ncbi:hypothetical protein DJ524_07905, partial [Sulfolobus sp. D5]